ncbi:hypothetical protein IFM89_017225 [Coptis chinensis]|uniref:PB1-like domain-containing protein n=1 Tax=Coptis chinensis TaxID=261450 RepID=A0A835LLX2_9MAGN|nr:hypothetical protein IFM89_017225 [Coptis chinensis]
MLQMILERLSTCVVFLELMKDFICSKANLMEEGSFDSIVAGCEGVFHTASPCYVDATDPQYDGGELNCSYEDMNAKMTYLYLRNLVKDFGYPPRSIAEILFNTPGVELENGLRTLRTDSDVSSMVKEADVFGNIEVYVVHKQSDEHDSDASDDSASQSKVGSIDNVSDEELFEVRHMRVEMKKCKQNIDENGKGASQTAADDINGEGTSAPPDVVPNEVFSEETEHTGYDSEYGEDGDYSTTESDEEDEAI